jgi:hypothetical protein
MRKLSKLFLLMTLTASYIMAFEIKVIDGKNKPVVDADLVLINKNVEYEVVVKTNSKGVATGDPRGGTSFFLMCAHPKYSSYFEKSYNPNQATTIKMKRSRNGGSMVILGTGYIPGVQGRINPIHDDLDRYYVYGTDLDLEGGAEQPVPFKLKKKISGRDKRGNEFTFKVVEMVDRRSLIEYEVKH